ncbi:MAG: hypothetical protein HYV68_01710 [Candidatus Taylorbacteria bacterium]|nr:hypothetical protein [Candidatus Taylorbacteria bacterium]
MKSTEKQKRAIFDIDRHAQNFELDIDTVDTLDGRFEVNGPVEKMREGSFGWLRVGAEPVSMLRQSGRCYYTFACQIGRQTKIHLAKRSIGTRLFILRPRSYQSRS